MVGCKNGLLVNNTLSDTGVAGADDAFQTKGGSYNIGIYNNTLTNCGNRVIQIGGNTGADFFLKATSAGRPTTTWPWATRSWAAAIR